MKQIMTVLLLFLFVTSRAQETAPLSKEQYRKKSNGQLITGIALSTGGVALIIAGISQEADKTFTDIGNAIRGPLGGPTNAEKKGGAGLLVAGVACAAASIPFYIASGRNRNKSRMANATFIMEQGKSLVAGGKIQRLNYPALKVVLRL